MGPRVLRAFMMVGLVIFLVTECSCTGIVIMEEPSPEIVPINSTATFYCAVAAKNASIEWSFTTSNNKIVYNLPNHIAHAPGNPIITDIDEFNGTRVQLSIDGLAATNGSQIRCTILQPDFYQSDPALLTVYGPPDPPSSLTVTPVSPLTLNISWSKPFIPYNEIPFFYHFEIFNQDNTLVTEQQLDSNTTNYILNITSEEEICKVYTFKIRSENDAGHSNTVSTTGAIPHAPTAIKEVKHQLAVTNDSVAITVQVTQATSSCYPHTTYTIVLWSPSTNSTTLSINASQDSLTTTATIPDVEPDQHYTATITPVSPLGNGPKKNITFMSTDVQNIDVEVDGTMVTVTCILATGSTAKGCVVQLLFNDRSITEHITRQDEDTSTVSGTLSLVGVAYDTFEVRVFDYEEDGSVGNLYWSDTGIFAPSPTSTTTGTVNIVSTVSSLPPSLGPPVVSRTPVIAGPPFLSSTTNIVAVTIAILVMFLVILSVFMLVLLARRWTKGRSQKVSVESDGPPKADKVAVSACTNGYNGDIRFTHESMLSTVEPYGVTNIVKPPEPVKKSEPLYQELPSGRPQLQSQSSTTPLLTNNCTFSEDSTTPPPLPHAISPAHPDQLATSPPQEHIYHILEQNSQSSVDSQPAPPLYDEVPHNLIASTADDTNSVFSTTPTNENPYHTPEYNESPSPESLCSNCRNNDFVTGAESHRSLSTLNSRSYLVHQSSSVSGQWACHNNVGGSYEAGYEPSHYQRPRVTRQNTIPNGDVHRTHTLPNMGRSIVKTRCSSESAMEVFGISEQLIGLPNGSSMTLKRTLV